MRYKLERSNTPITLKMWMFPVLNGLVIGFIVASLTTMVELPEHRSEVTATGVLALLTVALGLVSQSWRKALPTPKPKPEMTRYCCLLIALLSL